jgi:hypothetical protein
VEVLWGADGGGGSADVHCGQTVRDGGGSGCASVHYRQTVRDGGGSGCASVHYGQTVRDGGGSLAAWCRGQVAEIDMASGASIIYPETGEKPKTLIQIER